MAHTACRVIEHAVQIADADVIRPRDGQIDAVDELGLVVGKPATAIVKAYAVMVGVKG